MFNTKVLKTAAIFLALLGFATVQIKAQIPIVQADTIFAGFGGGSVSGIVFGPTGETVIVMHNAQPVEIDIKTKQIVREFEKVPNASGEESHLFFNKQKNYVGGTFYSSEYFDGKVFSGEIIWDYLTGKILKAIPNVILLTDGNMERYYTYFNHNFCSYDFETFKLKDSFNLNSIKSSYVEWRGYGIIPNSNKVLIGLNNYTKNEQGNKTYLLSELYLLDFETKKYTKIPIPFESGQKSSEITNITVSETGKYNIVKINILGSETVFFIYDKDFVLKFKVTQNDLEQIINSNYLYYCDANTSINDNYLLFSIIDRQKPSEGAIFYDIQNKMALKYLRHFPTSTFSKATSKIALIDENGRIGLFDYLALPVQDNPPLVNTKATVNYIDTNLVITSTTTETADINISDYNGVLLQTQKNVFLQKGSNNIKVHIPLQNGVYFCIVKTLHSTDSYKFMVNN